MNPCAAPIRHRPRRALRLPARVPGRRLLARAPLRQLACAPLRLLPCVPLRLLACALLLAWGPLACGPEAPLEARIERGLLVRERAALQRELARAAGSGGGLFGGPGHEAGTVVAVPASLLRELVSLALPVRTTVGGFRIEATSGEVELGGGLARVRLAGRVERVGRADVQADVEMMGVLDVVGIDEETGSLTARVEVFGFRTRDVRVAGMAPPVERLLDELAARPMDDLNRLLERIEIPVRLAETVHLPAVAEADLTIGAADVPLRFRLRDARVAGDHLWAYIDVDVEGGG